MAIPESGIAQRPGQLICIELKILAGSRNRADIYEKADLMGAQQADKFIDRSRRVAESPNCRCWRHGLVWHGRQGIASGPEGRGSLRRQFFRIDFEEPQSAVCDVFGLVEAIAYLHGPDEEIAAGHKREVAS